MSKELITALNALEKENGISKEVMLDTIEKSLKDEFKNQFNTIENCEVVLDRITGDFHIYAFRCAGFRVAGYPRRKGGVASADPPCRIAGIGQLRVRYASVEGLLRGGP